MSWLPQNTKVYQWGLPASEWSVPEDVVYHAVRAISSSEAEYYAALKGSSMALGFRSMAADLGEDVKVVLRSDSSVAMGVGGRQGLGKLRHLETGYLWLQCILYQKRLSVQRVKGTDNPADLGTKRLEFDDIEQHMTFLGFSFQDGRSSVVPAIGSSKTVRGRLN